MALDSDDTGCDCACARLGGEEEERGGRREGSMAQDPKLFRGRRARQVSRAQGGEMARVILIRQFTELVGTYVSRFFYSFSDGK